MVVTPLCRGAHGEAGPLIRFLGAAGSWDVGGGGGSSRGEGMLPWPASWPWDFSVCTQICLCGWQRGGDSEQGERGGGVVASGFLRLDPSSCRMSGPLLERNGNPASVYMGCFSGYAELRAERRRGLSRKGPSAARA